MRRLLSLNHPALPALEVTQSEPGRLLLLTDPVERALLDCFHESQAGGLLLSGRATAERGQCARQDKRAT